jgi:hypothetical protein
MKRLHQGTIAGRPTSRAAWGSSKLPLFVARVTFFLPHLLRSSANHGPRNAVASFAVCLESQSRELMLDIFTPRHSLPTRPVSMSDIQQYLLDYDRNRTEATATAHRSAARTCDTLWRGMCDTC